MIRNLALALVVLLFLQGCSEKEESRIEKVQTYPLKGKVEKGPFVSGSKVTLFELDRNFQPTGKSFVTKIATDEGDFDIGNVELISPFVRLVADGYFYNEVEGEISEGVVSLDALADLTNKQSVNVNILTHLKKDRILKMIKDGKTYEEANELAQNELLTAFALQKYTVNDASGFSVTAGNDEAGVLIATSAFLLGDRSEGEFTEYLSGLTEDFSADGQLSDALKNDLWNTSIKLDWAEIREDLINRYEDIHKKITVSDLTYYVDWDKNGIAGDELGDRNEEKKLSFKTDTIEIGKAGGTFYVDIEANLPYDFNPLTEGDQRPSIPSDNVTEESFFSFDFKEMGYTKILDKTKNQLEVVVKPADGAFIKNSSVLIYSMDGKLSATLILKQEGDMEKFSLPTSVMQVAASIFTQMQKASDLNYTMEAFYTQCYPVSNNGEWDMFYNHTLNGYQGVLNSSWSSSYSAMRVIYFIIESFEKQSDSKIYRDIFCNFKAMIYYQMVVLWGNIPYVDKVLGVDDVYSVPQLREQEMYERIKQDFLRAYKILPTKSSDPYIYVSKYVPAAMLAKVYMQTKEHAQAYQLLKEIINSRQYKLETNKQTALAQSSRELIYGIKLEGSDGSYKHLIGNYENLSIIRYAEVLLMASECCHVLGNDKDALMYLNEVRSNYSETGNATESNFKLLLKETWKNALKGEFSYFAFLKRNNLCEQELGIKPYQKLLPIPLQELMRNPDLNQNPGYISE